MRNHHIKNIYLNADNLRDFKSLSILRKKNLFTLPIFLVMFLFGCTQAIPLSRSIQYHDLSKETINKSIVIIMEKQLSDMEIISTPRNIPGAVSDKYRFKAGESIRINLQKSLEYIFDKVDFSNDIPVTNNAYDYMLNVKLKKYKIDIGPTIFSEHEVYLLIEYTLFDYDANLLFNTQVDSSGIDIMTGSEIGARISAGAWRSMPAKGYRASIGRAWDKSLANSLNGFLSRLDEYLQQEYNESKDL